jgi:preprotein translocase subunit SecE
MAKTNPIEFMREVRAEAAKVTWPTRREATVATVLVIVLSLIAAAFFFTLDILLAELIQLILRRG